MGSEKNCGNCKHFRLHYVKAGRAYRPLHYGHCVYPGRKRREAETAACEHYGEQRVNT
jgi:hypothetical protein